MHSAWLDTWTPWGIEVAVAVTKKSHGNRVNLGKSRARAEHAIHSKLFVYIRVYTQFYHLSNFRVISGFYPTILLNNYLPGTILSVFSRRVRWVRPKLYLWREISKNAIFEQCISKMLFR